MSKHTDTQEMLMQAIMAELEPNSQKLPARPVVNESVSDTFTVGAVTKVKPAMFKPAPTVIDLDLDNTQTDKSLTDLLEAVSLKSKQLKIMMDSATPTINGAVESIIHTKRIRRAKDAKSAYRAIIHALEDLEDAIDLLKHLI